jgi:hypothetical protein
MCCFNLCSPKSFLLLCFAWLVPLLHIDDQDGLCSFCTLKEHMEESTQRSGSVLVPARFKDNLSSILWIEIIYMEYHVSIIVYCHSCSLTRFSRIIFRFYSRTTRGCTWVPSLLVGKFASVHLIFEWRQYCQAGVWRSTKKPGIIVYCHSTKKNFFQCTCVLTNAILFIYSVVDMSWLWALLRYSWALPWSQLGDWSSWWPYCCVGIFY